VCVCVCEVCVCVCVCVCVVVCLCVCVFVLCEAVCPRASVKPAGARQVEILVQSMKSNGGHVHSKDIWI
jgi:hypothetical protein